jgi:DNA (cytosine-5)-methyltransferase 1
MEAGSLPKAPIWSNVRTFDGQAWRGKVSFISGGFPCQPYSKAGKQLAHNDPRDLWADFARIISEVRPHFLFLENVPNVVKWALPRILEDLSKMGYDAAWCVVAASEVGAPHKRARWFLFAYSNDSVKHVMRFYKPQSSPQEFEEKICYSNCDRRGKHANAKGRQRIIGKRELEGNRSKNFSSIDTKTKLSNTNLQRFKTKREIYFTTEKKKPRPGHFDWWKVEPGMGRMVDGVADWVHRMRACGNGVVPQQAAYAYSILMKRCGF